MSEEPFIVGDGVMCCGKVWDSVQAFYSHWGYKHEGPTPDDITRPEEQINQISEALDGHEVPEGVRKEISVGMEDAWQSGRYSRDEEKKAKSLRQAWKDGAFDDREMSEAMQVWWSNRPEEEKQAQFEAHSERMKDLCTEIEHLGKAPKPRRIEVDETGRYVRSKPEAQVDRMLNSLVDSYEYEPEFDLGEIGYSPDFLVGNMIIEVKGWPVTEKCKKRAEAFMGRHPEKTYVVYATTTEAEEVPSDRTVTTMRNLRSMINMVQIQNYPDSLTDKVVS